MPECQRCHFRLKESVQGLEHNIRRYRNSLAMHDALLTQYKHPLTFQAALSGPGTKCSVIRGLWNVVSVTSRKLLQDLFVLFLHVPGERVGFGPTST